MIPGSLLLLFKQIELHPREVAADSPSLS